ncbi:ATP phosphoribosyltransferase [Pseudoclavibacter chungangensis]|uniref:ATP phosphoribosyltransferase n=1 Tax=Pseudoclavibacter chungangensis TaxID=587635 RepID=A0A7J5BVL6_9MICO|nr:ATP phosphoribosyltransferase [Pseudoclavibacter chungangensis]KAB1657892.1 ATP phosphoribosyltransferase [Pseudoclavibacter chungangensis]
MLRIAVPNKGMLSVTADEMLQEAGYRGRHDSRELVAIDPRNNVEFFYLRPRDIATYVGSGVLDIGVTGRDLLLDAESEATEVRALDFGDSTFRFAGPAGQFTDVSQLQGKRVATSYEGLLRTWFDEHGIDATLVKLDGAVESAIRLGVADAVADVVSTGGTLRKAGLEVFGPVILESTAVLISTPEKVDAAATLIGRLEGVLVARKYALMDYDIPTDRVEQAVAVTPGFQSPTISPLRDTEWVAVRSMVPVGDVNAIMDELHGLGARAIIVTALQAARM